MKASNEFFSADASTPPQRVDGPPFDSADRHDHRQFGRYGDLVHRRNRHRLRRDPRRPRASIPMLSVGYGVRGNEDGLRTIIQNLATLAAVTISPTDPNGGELSTALNARLTTNLSGSPGVQNRRRYPYRSRQRAGVDQSGQGSPSAADRALWPTISSRSKACRTRMSARRS